MKKLLLSLTALFAGYVAYAQVVVAGVSPASIMGNYEFGFQAGCGTWPGETDDATWGVWPGIDFNNPGEFVQAELMLVEDGTPGLNPQGNPISQEGCNPLTNDLTGKIAVIYRNTCEFGLKVLNAQNAGAVAAIIVNREAGVMGMLGGVDGPNVTIPAVFLDNVDGAALIDEMANGPVVMFIGNKIGAYGNDVGAVKGEYLIAPFGGNHDAIFDGFDTGIQVYNYGLNDQNVTVTATIDGPTGNVYTESVGPIAMLSGDTVSIFPGNGGLGGYEFPAFNLGGVGNYPAGNYTLTYSIDMGIVDEASYDNEYSADFKVNNTVVASSRIDASNMPIANSYPSNSTTEYQSCMMFQEPNASNLGVRGVYFAGSTDTSVNQFEGAEIFVNAYQWDDAWVDLNDPNYTFDPTTNDAYQNLNLVTFTDYFPADDNEVEQIVYAEFATPFVMQDNTRYLFCLQTFESATISFGYDNAIDYGANYSIFAQPVSPVHVDGMWYTAGWNGVSAPAMGLRTFDPAELGLESTAMISGSAYPNPANDVVTVSVDATGAATLQVTDVAGKVVANDALNLSNGAAKVNIAGLESGLYIFNVTLENGQTSQFNVVKK